MRPGRRESRPRKHFVLRILLLLAVAAAVWTLGTYYLIASQGHKSEVQPADAIVVFGAAEYGGRPSPVLKARLDRGLELFQQRMAPMIITTGGSRGGDASFSEGGGGKSYLQSRGVPDRQIIAETQSRDTAESAVRVARIMKANGMRRCIAVSDDYHIFRIKHMVARQGIEVYGAPRAQTYPQSRTQRIMLILREVLSFTLWKLHLT